MAGNSQSADGSIAFFRKEDVVYDLSRWLGDVSHLSTQQLEKLINAIPEPSQPQTQASAVGNEERSATVRNSIVSRLCSHTKQTACRPSSNRPPHWVWGVDTTGIASKTQVRVHTEFISSFTNISDLQLLPAPRKHHSRRRQLHAAHCH